jgi:thiamine biosynthesis lipoprotein
MRRTSFRAMGTEVEVLLDALESAESSVTLQRVQDEFERLEALLSRFRPDSELSALNRSGCGRGGPELVEVTLLALDARERTSGRFDPTVHDALVSAGYDRTFDEIVGGVAVAVAAPSAPCLGRVAVDAATGLIELGPGTRLDLGGIAKGYAVDRACAQLEVAGPGLVNAGGDLAARGRAWPVGVETPAGTLTLELEDGAIATSGRDRRRWTTSRGEAHHLIDPATGVPAASDLLRVTVVARTAVEAEVLAKSLFLAGSDRAEEEADELRVPCVLVRADGRTTLAGGLR